MYNHYKRIYHNIPVNKKNDRGQQSQMDNEQQAPHPMGTFPSQKDLLHIAGKALRLFENFLIFFTLRATKPSKIPCSGFYIPINCSNWPFDSSNVNVCGCRS